MSVTLPLIEEYEKLPSLLTTMRERLEQIRVTVKNPSTKRAEALAMRDSFIRFSSMIESTLRTVSSFLEHSPLSNGQHLELSYLWADVSFELEHTQHVLDTI